MNKDQLDGLMAFRAVAETNSFSGAAKALNISHSAVSQIIKNLEERLDTTLITRTTRSVSLTEAGEKFLTTLTPAMDQIQSAFEQIASLSAKPSGTLKINLLRAPYPGHIEKIILSFMKKYPDISIELHFHEKSVDVVKGGFDAGIRLSDILEKDMVAIKIYGPIKWVVACSPKYLKDKNIPKHPRELLSHNCIRFLFDGSRLYDKWEFEKKGRELQVQVKGTLCMNDVFLMKSAAVNGAGFIFTEEDTIEAELKSGKLVTVLDDYAASSAGYYLYFPKSSQVLPKLRAFIDHVKESVSS